MRVLDMELELENLNKFKKWCINNIKPFTTEERWLKCDMKQELDRLGLSDGDD